MMDALPQIIGEIGTLGAIGALIWSIRLEGAVKQNAKDIAETKERTSKNENGIVTLGEALARIETKLDIMLKNKGAN